MKNTWESLVTYLMKKYSEKHNDNFITTEQFIDMLCFFIEEAEVINFVSEIAKESDS
ncbi:hypothetical protein [Clostridium botulinum]|uniref:hypothetical protein n=1 Tax=Clostridium botulinum TaxID=1491 RepID=UPI000ABF15B3|nr:hypothetical protein [Clostridium botulinum]MBY6846776.1 hypothetical protein [Clostridium botulinum]